MKKSIARLGIALCAVIFTLGTASAQFTEIGAGENTSFLVINFKDGARFQFAVSYNGSANGEDLLTMTRDAGIGFDLTLASFGFGNFVDGIGFDGHSNSGFGGGEDFWHYWTSGAGAPPSWSFSDVGIADRPISNGTWDGWVYGSAAAPELVPEPSAFALVLLTAFIFLAKRR